MAGSTSLLFDTERLYAKLSQDMLDAQTDEGEVPLLAPSNGNYGYVGKPAFKPTNCCGATPAWDAFWFVIPGRATCATAIGACSNAPTRRCSGTWTNGYRVGPTKTATPSRTR